MTLMRYLSGLAVLVLCFGRSFAEDSTPQSFRELHALIKPHANELAWTKIPWLTSLWEARRRAAEQGKPILLWEMDGHPLGCT
jgi:hypothetical protein